MSIKKEEISIEEVKKLSPQFLMRLINKAKKYLKTDEAMVDAFKDHGVDIKFLDFVPMAFDDLEVSAQTRAGVVYLNYALLCDGDFFKDYGYLIHETTHFLQQCFGNKPTQGSDDGNYLDNESEQESFQYQAQFLANEFGQEEAEEYIEDLIDHHEVPKDEKEEKKDLLLAKANHKKEGSQRMNLKEKINMFYKMAQKIFATNNTVEDVLRSANLFDNNDDVANLLNLAGVPDTSKVIINILVERGPKVSFNCTLTPENEVINKKLFTLLIKKYSVPMAQAIVKAGLEIENSLELFWKKF